MAIDVRDDRRYLDTHEWVLETDGTVRIGLSDFAQDELGDIVYIELPEVGDELEADEAFGVIESIKAVSDMYAPVSGEVVDRNEELFEAPELINESPYDDAWMLEIDVTGESDSLMSAEDYDDQLA